MKQLIPLIQILFGASLSQFLLVSTALGQNSDKSLFDILYGHEDLQIYLELDLDNLLESKMEDISQQSQVVFIANEDTLLQSSVIVSPRGKFRRKECLFPPLQLDFPKMQLEDLMLDSADHYKVVTHCNDPNDTDQIVYKEYLTYHLYRIITKKSYRTIWFQIHYIDIEKGVTLSSNGFMLESNEELRRHLNGTWINNEQVLIDSVDAFQFELAALFQYMIGNRDMHLLSQHNVKLLRFNNPRKHMPIPYDFDFSLFVKPPYAYPGLANRYSVRRIYLGYQRNQRYMTRVFSRFLTSREQVLGRIESDRKLAEVERKELLHYLQSFYNELKANEYQMSYRLD